LITETQSRSGSKARGFISTPNAESPFPCTLARRPHILGQRDQFPGHPGFETLKSLDISVQMLCAEWETMSNLPVNVAVFFGKVDKRPSGWYWTPISEGHIPNSGSIAGPFENKAAAVEDAHQAAITPDTGGNDVHERRGI
jgi:hypothetical protein